MKRLFTFGDSFSQYLWPMWPDIVGQSFDETYNYGRAGTGNLFIFYKVMQAIIEKNITSDDVVIIQWTSPTRFDIVYNNGWAQTGDATAKIFRDNNLEHLNSDHVCVLKQLTFMNTLAKVLDSINCKWHYMFLNKFSMVQSDSHAKEFGIEWSRHADEKNYRLLCNNLEQYKHKFVNQPINDFVETQYSPDPWSMRCSYIDSKQGFLEYIDAHPVPNQTLHWIKEHVMPVVSGLSVLAMTNYSNHSNSKLISASNQQGAFNLYNPADIVHAFSNFNLVNNYKFISTNA